MNNDFQTMTVKDVLEQLRKCHCVVYIGADAEWFGLYSTFVVDHIRVSDVIVFDCEYTIDDDGYQYTRLQKFTFDDTTQVIKVKFVDNVTPFTKVWTLR